ncbi:MAG: hypothetical protein F6K62_18335 [Sphaerospermopsis sp. SIO1G2]|nr:hypothetical protein [Sphaerospermopsis sp. SIO1G1]NET72811.1 hypothetical protein [Sphaerospermopsis sp. SIO1G2]
MNDKFTLIAAATGGLMLSVALSSVLNGTPVTNLRNHNLSTNQVNHLQMVGKKTYVGKHQG